MAKHFRNRQFMTPSEQRGTLLLAGLVCVVMLVAIFTIQRKEKEAPLLSEVSVDSLFADSSTTKKREYKPKRIVQYDSVRYPRYPKRTKEKPIAVRDTTPLLRDSFPPRQPKYEEGTMVNLNTTDTTELKMIPGIGSAIARLIVGYRQQLGGYSRIEQLKEINLDAERLRSWFVIDSTQIAPININQAGINRLRNHPYLNFYQAKVIVEHRRKHGDIRSLKQLSLYEEFTETDLARLSPYVCFE